ncbi:MAG: ABC transporter ATP-binding protein [Clostridiales bacterium]|nr:ABC transporter ATP-binding protein [Clostridiales bacterium]
MENLFEIRDLTVDFPLRTGTVRAVNHVDLDIPKGKVLALVGESGSGKSTLATAIIRLVPIPGKILSGQILYKGKDVLKMSNEELNRYRWEEVSMVFQAAQNSLNPVMTVKEHFLETAQIHSDQYDEEETIKKVVKLLEYVRLEANRVLRSYPHELSGGMKQRVLIALSMLLDPQMIILDEPTTALDVITQDYIFNILKQIHEELGITMLLLTHDIAVVAKVAQLMGVMYAGHLVEIGEVREMFRNAVHPYTRQLLRAAPSLLDELRERNPIMGGPPDPYNMPEGCPFHPRCSDGDPKCSKQKPRMIEVAPGHKVMCNKSM